MIPPDRLRAQSHGHSLTITLLRGFAAIAVVLYHASYPFRTGETPAGGILPTLVGYGWFGVDLFFLISGYCLAAKLAGGEKLCGPAGATTFLKNRFWRIYPLYWAACLVVLALAWTAGRFNNLDWSSEFPSGFAAIVASLLLIEPLTATPAILPVVSWTLTCEIAFYAIVAAAILLRARVADVWLVIAATVLAALGTASRVPGPAQIFTFWPEFVCGLLVFAAGKARGANRGTELRTILAALVLLAILGWASGHSRLVATLVVGFAVIAVQRFETRFGRGGPLRWLAWISALSFPLFLLHVPVISRATNLGRRMIPQDDSSLLLLVAGAVALAVAVAWVVHNTVEKPLLRFASRTGQPAS